MAGASVRDKLMMIVPDAITIGAQASHPRTELTQTGWLLEGWSTNSGRNDTFFFRGHARKKTA